MEILNLILSASLLTLILLIQLLHYPSFSYYDSTTFAQAMQFHQQRISWVVIPLMLAELAVCLWLVIERGGLLAWGGLTMVGLIWLVTYTQQVPAHQKLLEGKNEELILRLTKGNWLRTGLWTLKLAIAVMMAELELQ